MDNRSTKELVAEWLAGDLDAAGTAHLLQLCREQPELLEEVARYQSLDRQMRAAFLDAGPDAFIQEVAARCGISGAQRDITARVHWRLRWRRWTVYAAAACIAVSAGVYAILRLTPVAEIAALESAQWSEGRRVLRVGEKLRR